MTVLRAHFDGKVLIPIEPIDLPIGPVLDVQVQVSSEADAEPPLMRLVKIADQFPPNPNAPPDGAAQHDHYLYGTRKKP